MDFYLFDGAGGFLHFPVNPQEVTIKREKLSEVFTLLNLGENEIATGEKLKEISFSSFFPRDYDSFCQYADIPDPQAAMNLLTLWTMSRRPVRLIITKTIINVLVLVIAHTSTFKGGEPGDVYFEFTARTWRNVGVRTAPMVPAGLLGTENRPDMEFPSGTSRGLRADFQTSPGTYTVNSSSETVFDIAVRLLGDSNRWEDIYELNRNVIGANPFSVIPIGTVLTIPV